MLHLPLDAMVRRHLGIVLVTAAFLALGAVYSVVTPLFEASDELWHYPYVKHLADGRGLPVQQPEPEANVARQEGGQPPLYYLVAALATFWIDTGAPEEVMWANPHAIVGEPLAEGNKNLAIHTDAEGFPYRGVSLAVHLVRLLTVGMGAATVVLAYLIALEVFPGQRALAVGAAAATAFLPQFLFISASVDNDALVSALSALILYLLLRSLRRRPGGRTFLLLGLALGMALLSKLSALGLLPLVAAALAYLAWRDGAWRAMARGGVVVVLAAAAVSGWWYVRNWVLYGEPTGLSMHLQIVGTRHIGLGQLWSELEGMKLSFFAVFGGFNLLAPRWFYQCYDLALFMAALGLVLLLAQRGRQPLRSAAAPLLLTTLWAAIVGASFLRWAALTLGGTGRLLFPALPVLALFFVLGLAGWVPRRRTAALVAPLAAGMFLLAAYVPFGVVAPAYARPRLLSASEELAPSQPFEAVFGRRIRLLGYDVVAAPASGGGRSYPSVRPGEHLRLRLYWRGLREMERDYSYFVHLFDNQYRALGELNSYPGAGTYPTSLWPAGVSFRERASVPVFEGVEGPLLARVETGFYWLPTMERLEVESADGRPLPSSVRIATVRVDGGPPDVSGMAPLGARLGGFAELVGYRVEGGVPEDGVLRLEPGSELPLRLFWRALAATTTDYAVFAHLLGGDQVVAQHDADPREGNYPTSAWEEGELVPDDHRLVLPASLPPGAYQMEVGMYERRSGRRLPVAGGGDRVVLFEVVVR